jgi:hypothetical protein
MALGLDILRHAKYQEQMTKQSKAANQFRGLFASQMQSIHLREREANENK